MFRSLRLIDAFEHLATPDEWHWFGPMVARGNSHCDKDGWPLFSHQQLSAYDALWKKLVDLVHRKLRAGEWVAQGISAQFGPRRMEIDTYLWEYLQIVHRTEEAEGAGFRFLALTVSDVEPPRAMAPLEKQPLLRRQLTDWIRAHAESATSPPLRVEQIAAARAAFAGQVITENMYRECRRAAGLTAGSVRIGRPKAKGSDI